jgi:hypothetical protein
MRKAEEAAELTAVAVDESRTVIVPHTILVYMENPYRDSKRQCGTTARPALVQVGEMVASSSLEDGKKLLVQGVNNLEGQYGEARAKSYTLHLFAHDVEQVLSLCLRALSSYCTRGCVRAV